MATFKPAYLIHGDDHGRIAERRARLRSMAEAESGTHGVEVLEGDASSPENVALALNAMTFAVGRRFIIVDGVERWKEKELPPLLEAIAHMAPDTTIALFAREDGRAKALKAVHESVRKAGGDVAEESGLKPWELPKWVVAQAAALGLQLDGEAARALLAHVGDRQQRLLRELEKVALGAGASRSEPVRLDAGELDELTASSAERKVWSLADAMVAGDGAAATRLFLALRVQGERVPGLLYWIGQRIRAAHEIAVAVESGEPTAKIKGRLRMPSKAADRLIADARGAGVDRLRAAVEAIADLELTSRGGSSAAMHEDTAMLRTIQAIAG
ncbi:MAG: DNA polymerase III subunit delta [Solirubrobacteraceae bacterium]